MFYHPFFKSSCFSVSKAPRKQHLATEGRYGLKAEWVTTFWGRRPREAESRPLWRSRTCAAGRSFARGWAWRPPPCRSPPVGCPASAPPSKRSRRARRPPRSPRSWRGSRAGRGCCGAASSPTSRNLWWWSENRKRVDYAALSPRKHTEERCLEQNSKRHLKRCSGVWAGLFWYLKEPFKMEPNQIISK